MRKILAIPISTLFMLIHKSSVAQLEADHWMISGYGYYVYFNHGTNPDTVRYPPPYFNMLASGAASYSDYNGNLLFFADGWKYIYDRNFEIFPSLDNLSGHGTPLYGTQINLGFMTQPVLAVPYPNHDSLYILFHIYCDYSNQYKSSLHYSVINMNLRNGLGEIYQGQKNIPLLNGADVGFKLTATLHCNKKDIWVIGHLLNSDKYYSLQVTENGVSLTPVYFTGNIIPSNFANSDHPNNVGCLKVSASGNKLAAAYQGLDFIELFDFNTQTGLGTNLKTITAHPPPQDTTFTQLYWKRYGPIGVDFSPSGNVLYTTSNYDSRYFYSQPIYSFVYQFDASLPTAAAVQNSQYRVDSIESTFGGAIQIGNNGKMYVKIAHHLCEIDNPEILGAGCGFKRFTVVCGQQYGNVNLPVFLQSYFRYPVIANGNCHFQNINFSVQNLSGVNNILWDFDDPASGVNNRSSSFTPTHIFSQEGYYLVKAILYNANGCGADTVRKQVYAGEFKVFLGNDTTICEGDSLKLTMKIPNAGNLWSNTSKDTVITVTKTGKYWVRVSLGECTASDTINIAVRPLPAFTLGKDTTICSKQSCTLSPNSSPSNPSYLWNTGATTSTIATSTAGTYWLKIKDVGFGCEYADSINVSFKSLPNYNLGGDTSLCENEPLTLNAGVTGATSYLWNTGATTSSVNANQTNIYWADVTKDNCVYRDSISVLFKPLPIIDLGSDTTLCEDQTLLLDAQNLGSQYLWQDYINSQTRLVTRKGNYWVKVTSNGCSSSDSIFVNFNLKPVFSLGNDTVICIGQTITLQAKTQNNVSGVSWLWDNGRTSPNLSVTQTGDYVLQASNFCGTRDDTIKVSKGVCKLYVPSAFTPNNDWLNDVFRASFGENIVQFSLDVYNRWGQKVFYSTDINKGWDGKISGTVQSTGTYVWMIRYKMLNDVKEYLLKGTVTLIR